MALRGTIQSKAGTTYKNKETKGVRRQVRREVLEGAWKGPREGSLKVMEESSSHSSEESDSRRG